MHVTTFMLNPIPAERAFVFLVYFLFQIPYFLCGSLALNALQSDEARGGARKAYAVSMVVSSLYLAVFYAVFIVNLGVYHRNLLMTDRLYIAGIGILPLILTLAVANGFTVFLAKRTRSVYPGLFMALLWSTWLMVGANAVAALRF